MLAQWFTDFNVYVSFLRMCLEVILIQLKGLCRLSVWEVPGSKALVPVKTVTMRDCWRVLWDPLRLESPASTYLLWAYF